MTKITPANEKLLWRWAGAVITILLGINGYFIKGLVDKVDRVDIIEQKLDDLKETVNRLIDRSSENEFNPLKRKGKPT